VYGLGEDEKAGLKQWLLGHVEEPERKVAVQLAVVVADIARRDWPGDWEPLFTSLLSTVHSVNDCSSNDLDLHLFADCTLNHFIKQVCTTYPFSLQCAVADSLYSGLPLWCAVDFGPSYRQGRLHVAPHTERAQYETACA